MPSKAIVEDLNVLKEVQSGLCPGSIVLMKDQLGFEGAEETLDGRIVVTITFTAHTTRL